MYKRIEYIDNAKALGIFLIVLGHIPITNQGIREWIFLFHVPLFFFISGFLHKQMGNVVCLKKATYTLIIPFVIYFLIGSIVFPAFQNYFFYREKFTGQFLLIEPTIKFLTGTIHSPIWFLLALFWMKIVYNTLINIEKVNSGGVLILSIIMSYTFNRITCDFNYYQIGTFILSFPFYVCGNIVKNRQWLETISNNRLPIKMCIIGISLIGTFIGLRYWSGIDISALHIGNNIFTMYFSSICGILMVLAFSMLFCSSLWICVISQGTLFILGTHMMLIQIFKLLYKKALHITVPPPYIDIYSGLAMAIAIIVILYYPIKKIITCRYAIVRILAGKR